MGDLNKNASNSAITSTEEKDKKNNKDNKPNNDKDYTIPVWIMVNSAE